MSEDWSRVEVEATVSDYFAMLASELKGERFVKADHRRRLQKVLSSRSPQAIEFKHANISAALIELGYPYIDGYKPRSNYQQLLHDVVVERLEHDAALQAIAEASAVLPAETLLSVPRLEDVFVKAPVRDTKRSTWMERRQPERSPRLGIQPLEIEAMNASLGAAGENYVLRVEHARLWQAGKQVLANRIEHVSRTRGDGLGYDILSFDESGRERLIEVKTTRFGDRTPFFASRNEVALSEEQAERFQLYRVFKFNAHPPKVFVLPGSLRQSCILDPVHYQASLP